MQKKIRVKMNKSVYLGLSILEISKSQMYEFWYDYIKPKYQQNAKLFYMFMKILQTVLRKYLIHQIMKSIVCGLQVRIKK